MNIIIKILQILILTIISNISLANYHVNDYLSLDFDSISTKKILQILAKDAHKNIVISDKVTGKVSVKLDKVTWREALDIILNVQGLIKHESANYIYIAPISDDTNFAKSQFASLILKLNYAKADELIKLLQNQHDLISNLANINADIRTNSILIREAPDKIPALKNIIKRIDVPMKQVLIEGRIVTIDDNYTQELGIKYSTASDNKPNNKRKNDDANNNNNVQMDLPFSVNDPGHFGLAVAKIGEGVLLDMELAALEDTGHARIISKPELLTANLKPAYIESGQEIPYQEKTSSGATSVEFKKAVLSLKVTPEIISADKINLTLQMNQDKVSSINVNGVPAIQTQQIQTDVEVANNQTIVLGGIYEQVHSSNKTRIPFLGAIPILGNIFSYKETQNNRKELLIFVTIKLI